MYYVLQCTAENRAAQDEEMEVLQSIYGSDFTVSLEERYCQVRVIPLEENTEFDLDLHMTAYFPESYPSSSPPIAELKAPWLQESTRERLNIELGKLFDESIGDVVMFRWIEWLKELVWLWDEAKQWIKEQRLLSGIIDTNGKETEPHIFGKPHEDLTSESMSRSECMVESGISLQDERPESSLMPSDDKCMEELDRILGIVHGAPFTEKKSTFQAHLSSVTRVDQVETVMEALLGNRKIAGATHNIMAYRINIPEKGTVVVVSRWFGGILLGPDRFKHINNAARSLLLSCGYVKSPGSTNSTQQKHGKGSSQKGKKK